MMQSHIEVVIHDDATQEIKSRHEVATEAEGRRLAQEKAGSYSATVYVVHADGHREKLDLSS